MAGAKKPIIYSGGGVSIPARKASQLLRELVELTGFPDHLDADGPRRLSGLGKNWLGMLGMHGTYEANMAMHDCDVMICIGARFDDRITGRLNAFSPNSKKIHIDIDPSSINKNVRVDVRHRRRCRPVLEDMVRCGAPRLKADKKALYPWWEQIAKLAGAQFASPTSRTTT
jgi:acetolactate synthase-1/2/3 large subunit